MWILIPIKDNVRTRLFYGVRGIEVIRSGKKYYVAIPSVCPHLTEDNKCDIYTNRPMNCRGYSANTVPQEILLDGCGYKKEVKT